mmetsp:Transcript_12520/g.18764  ORF Transcript_12520/g.18764 Transcript_12520/m.18764 type:complete len:174 (-) Transcript_12520:605-1126(-)
MGGLFIAENGDTYGVTCGHCIRVNTQSNDQQPKGSSVFQPCAMGMIVNAASLVPGLLNAYDTFKESKGDHEAMRWMIDQLRANDSNFTTNLPSDAICGQIHGGVLGPLDNNGGTSVDVGLIKLSVSTLPECEPSMKFSEVTPPMLLLGKVTTANMRATLNPVHLLSHIRSRKS